MHPETKDALAQLEQADWFLRVGLHELPEPFIHLSSWDAAMAHCDSDMWHWVHIETANQICTAIASQSRERFRKWNELVSEIRPIVTDLVRSKVESVMEANDLPDVFETSVRWDILHLCMECEYLDLSPPRFYGGLSYQYVTGHFPCGWEGPLGRRGKLIVF